MGLCLHSEWKCDSLTKQSAALELCLLLLVCCCIGLLESQLPISWGKMNSVSSSSSSSSSASVACPNDCALAVVIVKNGVDGLADCVKLLFTKLVSMESIF